jgi:predicted xylose isomerase-like sugar epimerase
MTKEKLTETVSFKLSESQFAPYKAILEATEIKKSKLFREVFIAKAGEVVLSKEQTKDNKRLLFLASKTSNNINQLARQLNKAYRGGIVSESVYVEMLNNLVSIEKTFAGAIDQC